MNAQTLKQYININYGSQSLFAKKLGKTPPEINSMIKRGYIVVDGNIYMPSKIKLIEPPLSKIDERC